ncbi:divalent metal cation transporter [Synechococcus sp. CS-1329]|uniref:NRAMP family divalent metal transporter n=1 Tax=Synechococcus sp. CS-1329 TaxID=2847975 RepID=UPI00223C2E9B|nr:divalent metal cation transporter [Synechococcus sp. CS-1329]MCT0219631.1 divalent metal cation transporter [Synechococcus sp. CS-1329]
MIPTTDASRLSLAGLRQSLGPGILLAGAAIGGSHLVASTQAGARYGLGLLGLVLLINLIKYPFLLVGTRFTAATGLSLLEGYQRQERWYLPLFLLITAATGVANIAAVAAVTGSLATSLLPASIGPLLSSTSLAVLLLGFCLVLLLWGHYRSLDRLSKVVIAILVLSTTAASLAALLRGPASGAAIGAMFSPSPWTLPALPFLIALMGWMPCPLDLAAWSSLWIFARREDSGHRGSRAELEADFNLGYAATVLMAVLFLVLGAWVMHGTGRSFSPAGARFAQQLIELYTASLGSWAYPLIALAAFTTMFSTTLTCLDGYPRSASAGLRLLRGCRGRDVQDRGDHSLWMAVHGLAAAGVLLFLAPSMGALVQLAMVVSFVTTPLLGWMNLQVIQGRQVPPDGRLGPALLTLARAGLVVLTGFVVIFALSR